MYVCVCMCVCERERKKERKTDEEREHERDKDLLDLHLLILPIRVLPLLRDHLSGEVDVRLPGKGKTRVASKTAS